MKLRDIEIPIINIAGVGQSLAKHFAAVNVFTVADLFQYYPRDWEDRTKTHLLSSYSSHPKIHTLAEVVAHEWFGFGRMKTLKILIRDASATASLICFNRPFFEKSLPVGSIISVTGSFSLRRGELQCSSFDAISISKTGSLADYQGKTLPDSAVLPIYPLTKGLGQGMVRKTILKALKEYLLGIEDELPEYLYSKYNLLHKSDSIRYLHNPPNIEKALLAKKSLIFEELYLFQEKILSRVSERKKNSINAPFPNEIKLSNETDEQHFVRSLSPAQKQLHDRLSFKLTEDQIAVIIQLNAEIDASFVKTKQGETQFQMARLLQGDVGSGKTLVAFFACLRVVDWGAQCAILAPTEILSKQHAESASKLLEPILSASAKGIRVAFLTGNTQSKGRTQLVKALKNNEIDILIGTHALFSKNVLYNNLRLVIVDEQHRFGVIQRNAILDKGRTSLYQIENNTQTSPALLMMSATPIPQTLALTVYGDLDVSTIKSMPKGRKPIITHLTRQGNESRAYEAIRKELQKGRQAYFVYPRIEDAEPNEHDNELENTSPELSFESEQKTQLKSAEQMFDFLSKHVYPEFNCAVIHSKVDEESQSKILRDFRNNTIQVLVATSVVEVGVDVPNATCMAIEHAERFGLAALHQLRGRVGRGSEQSACFLIYSNKLTELGKSRLKVMHESTNGFFIAEEDLRLRGPGEVTGIQQSGYLTLGLADPVRDIEILQVVRKELLTSMSLHSE